MHLCNYATCIYVIMPHGMHLCNYVTCIYVIMPHGMHLCNYATWYAFEITQLMNTLRRLQDVWLPAALLSLEHLCWHYTTDEHTEETAVCVTPCSIVITGTSLLALHNWWTHWGDCRMCDSLQHCYHWNIFAGITQLMNTLRRLQCVWLPAALLSLEHLCWHYTTDEHTEETAVCVTPCSIVITGTSLLALHNWWTHWGDCSVCDSLQHCYHWNIFAGITQLMNTLRRLQCVWLPAALLSLEHLCWHYTTDEYTEETAGCVTPCSIVITGTSLLALHNWWTHWGDCRMCDSLQHCYHWNIFAGITQLMNTLRRLQCVWLPAALLSLEHLCWHYTTDEYTEETAGCVTPCSIVITGTSLLALHNWWIHWGDCRMCDSLQHCYHWNIFAGITQLMNTLRRLQDVWLPAALLSLEHLCWHYTTDEHTEETAVCVTPCSIVITGTSLLALHNWWTHWGDCSMCDSLQHCYHWNIFAGITQLMNTWGDCSVCDSLQHCYHWNIFAGIIQLMNTLRRLPDVWLPAALLSLEHLCWHYTTDEHTEETVVCVTPCSIVITGTSLLALHNWWTHWGDCRMCDSLQHCYHWNIFAGFTQLMNTLRRLQCVWLPAALLSLEHLCWHYTTDEYTEETAVCVTPCSIVITGTSLLALHNWWTHWGDCRMCDSLQHCYHWNIFAGITQLMNTLRRLQDVWLPAALLSLEHLCWHYTTDKHTEETAGCVTPCSIVITGTSLLALHNWWIHWGDCRMCDSLQHCYHWNIFAGITQLMNTLRRLQDVWLPAALLSLEHLCWHYTTDEHTEETAVCVTPCSIVITGTSLLALHNWWTHWGDCRMCDSLQHCYHWNIFAGITQLMNTLRRLQCVWLPAALLSLEHLCWHYTTDEHTEETAGCVTPCSIVITGTSLLALHNWWTHWGDCSVCDSLQHCYHWNIFAGITQLMNTLRRLQDVWLPAALLSLEHLCWHYTTDEHTEETAGCVTPCSIVITGTSLLALHNWWIHWGDCSVCDSLQHCYHWNIFAGITQLMNTLRRLQCVWLPAALLSLEHLCWHYTTDEHTEETAVCVTPCSIVITGTSLLALHNWWTHWGDCRMCDSLLIIITGTSLLALLASQVLIWQKRRLFWQNLAMWSIVVVFMVQIYCIDSELFQTTRWHSVCIGQLEIWESLSMIAEICAMREKLYFHVRFKMYCNNFGRKYFWALLLANAISLCKYFPAWEMRQAWKFLHMACTCRHYACTCSHYTGTIQVWAAACNMEERCLFEKLYLCSEESTFSCLNRKNYQSK